MPIKNPSIEYFVKSKLNLVKSFKDMKINSTVMPEIIKSFERTNDVVAPTQSQISSRNINAAQFKPPTINQPPNLSQQQSIQNYSAAAKFSLPQQKPSQNLYANLQNYSTVNRFPAPQPSVQNLNSGVQNETANLKFPIPQPPSQNTSSSSQIEPASNKFTVPNPAIQNPNVSFKSRPQIPQSTMPQQFSKSTHDLRAFSGQGAASTNPFPQPKFSTSASQISFSSPPNSSQRPSITLPQPPSTGFVQKNVSNPNFSAPMPGIPSSVRDSSQTVAKPDFSSTSPAMPRSDLFSTRASAPFPVNQASSQQKFGNLSPRSVSTHPIGTEANIIEKAPEIVTNFDNFISELKSKAAEKNSLIIRQRKNQCLNALSSYENTDKSALSPSTIEVMDLVLKRMERLDDRLKLDIDVLIEGQSDCIWLKAISELIKMLY